MRGPRLCGLLLLTSALALAPPVRAQQRTFEEGLYELVAPGVAERVTVVTLVDPAGHVLLPLDAVLQFTGIPAIRAGSLLVLEWPPGAWKTTVDPARGTFVSGRDTVRVPASDWVVRDGSAFLSAEALGALLHAMVKLDPVGLTAVFTADSAFPVQRALQLESERQLKRSASSPLPHPETAGAPYPGRTGGVAADWAVSASAGDSPSGELRGTVGAAVLGASIEGGGSVPLSGLQAGPSYGYLRLLRVFPDGKLLRTVQLGTVNATGPLGFDVRGLLFGNAPYLAPEYFDEAIVRPAVPSGWSAEVYQGGQLLGVTGTTSTEPVRAPLAYGATPVRIRLIGPAGEERTEEIHYVVPNTRIPEGTFQYRLGGGECVSASCRTYAFAELRHGFTSWATAGVGADRIARGDTAAEVRPYGILSLSPFSAASVELEGRANTFGRATVQYYGPGNSSASATVRWDLPGSPIIPDGGVRGDLSLAGRLLRRWLTVRGLVQATAGVVDGWQLSGGTPVTGGFLDLEYETGLQGVDLLTLRGFFTPRHTRHWPAGTALSGAVGVARSTIYTGELGLTSQVTRSVAINAAAQWRRATRTPLVSIGVATRLRGAFAQARGVLQNGRTASYVSASGGIASEGGQHFPLLHPYSTVGNAGLAGQVYQDRNGNGRRDPDEPPLAGIPLLFQGHREVTDDKGAFRAWDIVPYRVLRVGVDTLNMTQVDFAPTVPEVVLRPTPDLFNRVELGLVQTREVIGRVEVTGATVPAGGVAVEVLDTRGNPVREVRTFTDGTFYIGRVVPGTYRVRITTRSLEALGGHVPAERAFSVPADSRIEPIEVPPLIVNPKAATPTTR